MSWITIIKYLPYLIKIVQTIMDRVGEIDAEKDRIEFLTKLGDAFEKAKSGDTTDIERLLNSK